MIDQHAAQERVKYEYWKEKIGDVDIAQQVLLSPYYFDLPKNESLLLLERKDKLHEAGIFLEDYGENKFILRENPIWLKESEIEKVVYEMIDIVLSSDQFSLKKNTGMIWQPWFLVKVRLRQGILLMPTQQKP